MENEKRVSQFALRLPADMKKQIVSEAAANRRSVNAEILVRLEGGLSAPAPAVEDRGAAA